MTEFISSDTTIKKKKPRTYNSSSSLSFIRRAIKPGKATEMTKMPMQSFINTRNSLANIQTDTSENLAVRK